MLIVYILLGYVGANILTYFFIKETSTWERKYDEKEFVIKMPKVFSVVGLIAFTFCTLFMLWGYLSKNETMVWWVYLGFSFFALVSFGISYCFSSWRIIVKGDLIFLYLPFRFKKKYHTNEITSLKENHEGLIVYKGKRKLFLVPYIATDYVNMYYYLLNKGLVLEKKNGQSVKMIKDRKKNRLIVLNNNGTNED